MLANIRRKISYKIRRKLKLRTVTIGGVRLTTEQEYVPASIRKQLLQKSYEKQEYLLVKKAIKPNDRVLEIGAGIGFISLVCSRICGSENVLSYEPNPEMKKVIEKNYSLNNFKPNFRNKLVSAKAGISGFFVSENVLSSSMIDRQLGMHIEIQADAISDVINAYKPSAIVMDVEGAELELLRNCDLDRVGKIIIEMHPHIVGQQEVDKLLAYLGEKNLVVTEQLGKSFLIQRM